MRPSDLKIVETTVTERTEADTVACTIRDG
jgi:hypothetical protein